MTSEGFRIKTVAALVTGAALVGAGVALLYSPKRGVDTRREISRMARQTQDEATRLRRSMKTGVDKAIKYGSNWIPKKDRPSTAAVA